MKIKDEEEKPMNGLNLIRLSTYILGAMGFVFIIVGVTMQLKACNWQAPCPFGELSQIGKIINYLGHTFLLTSACLFCLRKR